MGQRELGSAGEMLAQPQMKSDVLGCCWEGSAKRSATRALICLKIKYFAGIKLCMLVLLRVILTCSIDHFLKQAATAVLT